MDGQTCTNAAAAGHLHVLQVILSMAVTCVAAPTCEAAVAHAMRADHACNCELKQRAGRDAVRPGARLPMERLRQPPGRGGRPSRAAQVHPSGGPCCCTAARLMLCLRGLALTSSRWARLEGRCEWDEYTARAAVEEGQLEVLGWLVRNGCPWDRATCLRIAKQDVKEWILQNTT